jgi:hypothetical protein
MISKGTSKKNDYDDHCQTSLNGIIGFMQILQYSIEELKR